MDDDWAPQFKDTEELISTVLNVTLNLTLTPTLVLAPILPDPSPHTDKNTSQHPVAFRQNPPTNYVVLGVVG